MGIVDFINKFKSKKESNTYAKMLNGLIPVFSQFGTDIYASDVVQQAINCIVMEMKKLIPQHIRENGTDPIPIYDDLQKLLDDPNERMTTSDLIEKTMWQLFLNYNAFLIPTYTTSFDNEGKKIKHYTGLYPIAPIRVEIQQNSLGHLFYYFKFINDYECTLAFEDVIHLKYRYSVNEFMGGNEYGQPDNAALLKTLELNNILLQGVGKALKSSFAINGIVKYNTLMDEGKTKKALEDLEKHLKANESGFLPMDIKGEFIPLQNKIQLVDAETLKFIDEKILRHFGVSLPILTGDYTKAQYEAFYQKTLEPLIISMGQEFTKKLFSPREKSFGNKVKFYPHELIFMDTSQKIELFDILVDSAACYKNEMRVAFGMKPLPELAGQIAESSNKTNAENNKQDDEKSPDKTGNEEDKPDDSQSDTEDDTQSDNGNDNNGGDDNAKE